ncbi:carbon-nitrogen hydrolase family protein [Kineococcus auxinigenes]|uniref:carbon-nitrogen hydrolase family protein n=1 Tax=unclassified Kineococcus TaxID=2621656 RepID=UPI003D7C7089
MSDVRAGMAQVLVEPGEREANLARAGEAVRRAALSGCDVVVLPECLDLGWTHESARTRATTVPGPVTGVLAGLAAGNGVVLAAGLVERSGERIHNSAVLVSDRGELLLHHRKVNELDFARRLYSTGSTLGVAETPFGVVGLDICADNSPSSLALGHSLGLMGAQLVLSPSAWAVPPDHDDHAEPYGAMWRESYGALARAHRMSVVGVSNVGPVVGGDWDGWRCIGCSLAVGPDGEVLAQGSYGERAEELLVVTVPVGRAAGPGRPEGPGSWVVPCGS